MERLISLLNSIEPISEKEKELMRKHLHISSIKKGEYFSERGKVCNEIGYVINGVLRVVEVDDLGNEATRYFINEGNFAVDLESYSSQAPSREYLEALTDASFIILTRRTMDLFTREVSNYAKIISRLTEKALLEKYNMKSEMVSDDASTRYAKLMQRNPTIIQRVPLSYISSFLGISQFTLSRIRKQHK